MVLLWLAIIQTVVSSTTFWIIVGKVRSIGVSNFEVTDLERLMKIAEIKPSLVQNLFDPFIQDMEVREFCQKNNIVYMGYR